MSTPLKNVEDGEVVWLNASGYEPTITKTVGKQRYGLYRADVFDYIDDDGDAYTDVCFVPLGGMSLQSRPYEIECLDWLIGHSASKEELLSVDDLSCLSKNQLNEVKRVAKETYNVEI